MGRRLALDGLRGASISFVLLFHAVQEFAPGGALGVDLVFALSSFLITSLLVDELRRSGRLDLIGFYWRRACRLGPALAVFLVVVGPTVTWLVGSGHVVTSTVAALFYVADFARAGVIPLHITDVYGHTWSLAIEEQFYLV